MSEINEYTFKTLIGSPVILQKNGQSIIKSITDIQIPRIQRDYAQGRTSTSVSKIRNRFLKSLYINIVNKTHLVLDFIYGDVEEVAPSGIGESEKVILTLLDGQQRVTTLFLLHWFIAKKEHIKRDEYSFLEHFSYATRISSRDFCKDLINYDFNIDDLLLNKNKNCLSLAETIKDQAWFQFDWKYDPTIQSMLVMLDSIYDIFKDTNNIWDNLLTSISFYFLPLHEMGLSDELYIKMNSRGKPLTPFEHFKADFERTIKSIDKSQYEYFSHHLDVEWADVFFPFRGENNIIDDELLKYFKFICSILCHEQRLIYDADEYKLADIVFGENNKNREYNLKFLKNSLDCLIPINLTSFYDDNFISSGYDSNKITLFYKDVNLFASCCSSFGDFNGKQRIFPLNKYIFFYASLIYFQNTDKINLETFKERFRVVRNLVFNSSFYIRDDMPDRMKNILNETKSLILTGNFSELQETNISFNKTQIDEEKLKLIWLSDSQNASYKNSLLKLECNDLLKGCIAIIGLDNKNNFDKFNELFNGRDNYDSINRALLSISDYSQFIDWRYQIGGRTKKSTWIDLFHPSDKRPGFKENTKFTINSLLNSIDTFDDVSLNDFADKFLNNPLTKKDWRYYLVKYKYMRDGEYGMYRWKDKNKTTKPYEIIMMNTSKSISGFNWEIFSYCLKKRNPKKLAMGNYSYNNEDLHIIGKNCFITITNSQFVIKCEGKDISSINIPQNEEGIDTVDRIEYIENELAKYFD